MLGVIIGVPTLRLRGDYLAIVTLGFGEIIPQVVRNGNSFVGYNVTNGPAGSTASIRSGFGQSLHGWFPFIPVDFTIQYNPDKFFYWSLVVLLAFTLFCMIRLRDSRLGRAWVAIREDEDAASAMGVPLMRTKTYAYAIGAFFGGAAGCFFAFYKGATFPNDFYLNISIFILCMVILGGMGNVWGVCVGAVLLAYLNFQGLNAVGNTFNQVAGTNVSVPKYQYLVYGTIIVIVMLFRPQGLIPLGAAQGRARVRVRRRRCRGAPADERARRPSTRHDRPARRTHAAHGVRGPRRLRRHRLHRAARLDRQPDRPERRRQDDVLQHADRRLHPDCGRDRVRRAASRPAPAASRSPSSASAARSRTSGSSRR